MSNIIPTSDENGHVLYYLITNVPIATSFKFALGELDDK